MMEPSGSLAGSYYNIVYQKVKWSYIGSIKWIPEIVI